MPLKKKIIDLIKNEDPQSRLLGYSILMGRLCTENYVEWLYILSKMHSTFERKAVWETICINLGAPSGAVIEQMQPYIIDFVKNNLNDVSIESLNRLFNEHDMNLFRTLLKKTPMSPADETNLKMKIIPLNIYARELNKDL